MAIINQHINEFLDYYLNLNEPQYAVLLSGKWGSGKTFFINQVTEKYQNSKNIVKVSLFGLKSKEDIHKKVLLKLFNIDDTHDVSVTAKLVGQVLKKFTGINLSDMPMGWALKQEGNQNAIFIFDDLERAGIELLELHGYINELTETHKQKVILLADEDKLNEDEKYILFKEKTIGKTFGIEQDFETAFKAFTDELKNAKEILSSNQSIIKAVFDTANYQNLRSLRQTILDFDHLLEKFEQKFKDHSELMSEIIQIFFAFSIEIKNGKFDIQMLKDMITRHVDRMLNEEKSDDELTLIENIFQKYSFLSYELILANESWIDLFTVGILNSERISHDLKRSRYFLEEQREEWIKLYHWYDLEDKQFSATLSDVLSKLQKNEYLQAEIFMHIVGILLDLSNERFYGKSTQEIVDDMKSYIDRNSSRWNDLYNINPRSFSRSYGSLGYYSLKTEAFQEIKHYFLDEVEKTIIAMLPKEGTNLLQSLSENDIETFQTLLSKNKDSSCSRFPVFTTIDTQMFLDALIQIPNRNLGYVFGIFETRYERVNLLNFPFLVDELDFWKSMYDLLNEYMDNNPSKIKTFWMRDFCRSIDKEIIQRIETHLQQIEKEKNNVK